MTPQYKWSLLKVAERTAAWERCCRPTAATPPEIDSAPCSSFLINDEAIAALNIETTLIFGHSFGGQIAALVAEVLPAGRPQPILINPALGAQWDRKLRLRVAAGPCWF